MTRMWSKCQFYETIQENSRLILYLTPAVLGHGQLRPASTLNFLILLQVFFFWNFLGLPQTRKVVRIVTGSYSFFPSRFRKRRGKDFYFFFGLKEVDCSCILGRTVGEWDFGELGGLLGLPVSSARREASLGSRPNECARGRPDAIRPKTGIRPPGARNCLFPRRTSRFPDFSATHRASGDLRNLINYCENSILSGFEP